MPKRESLSQVCSTVHACAARKRSASRSAGTTLIEILVVIVVFLIGILAVVQIFPKGFQLLLLNRNRLVAQTLARDYVEMLKSRPDQMPEMIVSAYYDTNGNLIIDPTKDPNDLSTLGATLNLNGYCTDASGNGLNNWEYITGSNIFRHVIGEGRRVPAPRAAGSSLAYFGGIMILQFGPVQYLPSINSSNPDNSSNVTVYGNDLEQIVGSTAYSTQQYNGLNYVGLPPYQLERTDYQYFVSNAASNSSSNPTSISFPTGSSTTDSAYYQLYAGDAPHRDYRVSFSAYVLSGGALVRHDYTGLTVAVAGTQPDASGQFPLSPPVSLQTLVNSIPEYSADQVQGVDLNTLRVQRFFLPIPKAMATFSSVDPYQYKLINENLGVLLFNPIGNGSFVSRQGHDREPLMGRVDYDVFDWRILHDDFRIDAGVLPGESLPSSPQLLIAQHKLPVSSLKVGGNSGPDGLSNTPIPILEEPVPLSGPVNGVPPLAAPGTTDTSAANGRSTDNFVLVDMETGGVFYEVNPTAPGQAIITVNKSTGVVTILDSDNNPADGITGALLLPDGTTITEQMDNRAVRALYMVNQEYSVQVLKAAAQYTMVNTPGNLSVGQFYIGGTAPAGTPVVGSPWRIYFPQCDNGRKVTVGEVTYLSSADSLVHQMYGQDFIIQNRINDTLGLPSIDLTQVDPNATAVTFQNGFGARGIKGDSVDVRVLWNPTTFHLLPDSGANLNNLLTWGQAWRISSNETFLQQEDNNR